MLCSLDDGERALIRPTRAPTSQLQKLLRYYNPDVHAASFILPEFAARELKKSR